MATPGHYRPVGDVVLLLHPGSWPTEHLFRVAGHPCGNTDEGQFLLQNPALIGLPVQPGRGCAGLGDPVEHHIGDELILREAVFRMTVTIAPRAELLDDPGEKSCR